MLQMKKNTLEIIELIEKNLGESCYWRKYNKPLPLVFSENFSIFECKSEHDDFILAIPNDPNISLDVIRGLRSYIKNRIYFYIESDFLSHELSINGIPYFNRGGRYNPRINNPIREELPFTKTTQLVVKYLLLSNSKDISTRQVANFFGVSNTSIKRAYDFLESIGAIKKEGSFTSTVSYSIQSKKTLLDCVKKYFILPYKRTKRMFVNYDDLNYFGKDMLYSAEHVLSRVSSLDNPMELEYAVPPDFFEDMSMIHESDDGDELITLEEWIYKIDYFSTNREIDLVDAYIIVSKRYENSNDTRIKSAIKQLEMAIVKND